jgi:pentatricopeptide repeat protein
VILNVNGLSSLRASNEAQARDAFTQHFPHAWHIRKCAEKLAASPYRFRVRQFLMLAHQSGVPFKHNVYEGTVHHLAAAQCWSLILSVVALAKRQSGRTTPRLTDWMLRAYIETSQFGQLDPVFEAIERDTPTIHRRTFQLLITGHLRNHDVESARRYLRKMETAGHAVDASTHVCVLDAYRGLGPDKEVGRRALEALREVSGRFSVHILNNLLQACLDKDDLPGALETLRTFKSSSPSRETTSPPSTLQSLVDTELDPDAATYTMLLTHMARIQDLSRAMQVIEQAHHAGLKPDTVFIAALIRVHFQTRNASSALAIVGRMCHGAVSYDLFVRLGAAHSPRHLPIHAWTSLRPDAFILNELADGLLNLQGLRGFLAAVRIMHACGIRPNDRTLGLLLSHLRKVERARPRELFQILRRLRHDGFRPTKEQYHHLLAILAQEERLMVRPRGWVRLHQVPPLINSVFKPRYISTTSPTFHPSGGFDFSTRLSFRRLVRPVLHSLASHGVRADRATIALRMKHDATVKEDVRSARSLFASMVAAGMHPNEYHYCALMEGYADAGNMVAAMDMMELARSAGLKPNVVMYTVLITGYARSGSLAKALRTFEEMLEAGVRPDHASVDTLCNAYLAAGDEVLARRLLLRLWPHVADMPDIDHHSMTLNELRDTFRRTNGKHQVSGFGPRSKAQRRMLRWKLRRIMDVWVHSKHARPRPGRRDSGDMPTVSSPIEPMSSL